MRPVQRWGVTSTMATLARIIRDGSSRKRGAALRDRRTEPRGTEAYLTQYVEGLSGEPAAPACSKRGAVAAADPRLQQKCSRMMRAKPPAGKIVGS